MIHLTRPLSDLRRTDQVSLRKDASRQYGGQGPQFSVPDRDAIVEVGAEAKARLGLAEENPASGASFAEVETTAPATRRPPSREVLERAVRSFGAEKDAQERGLRAPAPELVERADQGVPYDVLQRAVAAQDVEALAGADAEEPLPFTDDSPLLDAETVEGAQARTSFEVPESAGKPYGRDVPFDLTEEELEPEQTVQQGIFSAPRSESEVQRAGSFEREAVEQAADGSIKDPVAADVDRELLAPEAELRTLLAGTDDSTRAGASRQIADHAPASSIGAQSDVALVTRTKLQLASDAYRAAELESEVVRAQVLTDTAQARPVPLGPGFELTA
ncbi:MAG: hypothetical protein RJA70_4008 [Pseudomonadota bacterium]|jgi:hypothetical protein